MAMKILLLILGLYSLDLYANTNKSLSACKAAITAAPSVEVGATKWPNAVYFESGMHTIAPRKKSVIFEGLPTDIQQDRSILIVSPSESKFQGTLLLTQGAVLGFDKFQFSEVVANLGKPRWHIAAFDEGEVDAHKDLLISGDNSLGLLVIEAENFRPERPKIFYLLDLENGRVLLKARKMEASSFDILYNSSSSIDPNELLLQIPWISWYEINNAEELNIIF